MLIIVISLVLSPFLILLTKDSPKILPNEPHPPREATLSDHKRGAIKQVKEHYYMVIWAFIGGMMA